MTKEERMNVFRHYSASNRYNRLCIQQNLVRSAFDDSLRLKVRELETQHNRDFFDILDKINSYNYREEFLTAVYEDQALQKIMEAYYKRMSQIPR
jgi:hypothetical protein